MLPNFWVCRTKDKDYGVDLEVEIFDDEGVSTGLMFYVQLKATDDILKEKSVTMKTDRIEYLASLDAPSMIVRYCDTSGEFYFSWLSNVLSKTKRSGTKTVTIHFGDEEKWTSVSPASIPRTLQIYRTIRVSSRRIPIGLTLVDSGADVTSLFNVKRAIAKIMEMSRIISDKSDPDTCLPVQIEITNDLLIAKIDVIASIAWEIDGHSHEVILSQLCYILAYMAGRSDFYVQAENLIKLIEKNEYTTSVPELAVEVAILALGSVTRAVDVALLNGIHSQQDINFVTFINALIISESDEESKKNAVRKFYQNAIESQKILGNRALSAINYSLANFFLNCGENYQAIKYFNKARKLDSTYLNRAYFLKELASCLYLNCRFKLSANLYLASHEISPSGHVALCAGDALLFSSQFSEAEKMFSEAVRTLENENSRMEASLKVWLSQWTAEIWNLNKLNPRDVRNRAFLFELIDSAEKEQKFEDALGAAILEAFRVENDENLWADAMAFAYSTQDSQLILATFSVAIWRCGYDVYSLFRKALIKELEAHGHPADSISLMDQLAYTLHEAHLKKNERYLTQRLIDEEGNNHTFGNYDESSNCPPVS